MHLFEDSTTYQEIFQKGVRQGQINGRKSVLLQQGSRKFGVPSSEQLERLNRVNSTESLDHLTDRFFETSSWEDFLAGL
jgi:predicted transposase YdaD